MIILTIIILVVLYFVYKKVGLNIGSVIGGIIGLVIGSSIGVAAGGTAIAGTPIFGAIGFIIGGLMAKKNWIIIGIIFIAIGAIILRAIYKSNLLPTDQNFEFENMQKYS